MSKKLAEGCSGFVFDVKFGSGAFMADKKRARALAKSLSETASAFHKKSITFLTNMNQPLGKMIGHSLEVIECIETLKGQGPKDLTDLSLQLAGAMIYLAGKAKTIAAGIKMAQQTITDGSALKKFTEMVKVQGGQAAIVQNYDLLPVANSKTTIPFMTAGFLAEIDTKEVGLLMSILGGARTIPNQKIDLSVGMEFHGELGKKYKKGDALVTLYHHAKQTAEVAMITERMNNLIKMSRLKPAKLDPLILEILP
jgi:pyrimidine-nucleoside phosphorylase